MIRMVQSAKIYEVNADVTLKELYTKIESISQVDEQNINDETYVLRTLVKDVSWIRGKNIVGNLLYETLQALRQIDEKGNEVIQYLPVVNSIPFVFISGSLYFLPFAKYNLAETAASRVNKAIFGKEDRILKRPFTNTIVGTFLRQNPHTIYKCNWSGLDIPGVDKAGLGGADVERSPDMVRYESHRGEKKFVILNLRENGWVIGLSAGGSVIFYTVLEMPDMLNFIESRILPLL